MRLPRHVAPLPHCSCPMLWSHRGTHKAQSHSSCQDRLSHRASHDIPGPIADLPAVLPLETNRSYHILSWFLEMHLPPAPKPSPLHLLVCHILTHLHSLQSLTVPLFSLTCSSPKFLIIISPFLVQSQLAFSPFWIVLLFLLSGQVPGRHVPAQPAPQPSLLQQGT